MQQGQSLARQEAIVDEKGLFDRQPRVAALQFASAIILNTVEQDQILCASRRPYRVRLDKAQARDGPLQAGGLEKAARNHIAAKLLEIGGFDKAHASRPSEESFHRAVFAGQWFDCNNINFGAQTPLHRELAFGLFAVHLCEVTARNILIATKA